jgi:hypothetical protein
MDILLILNPPFVSKMEDRVSQEPSKEVYLSLPLIVYRGLILLADSLGNNTIELHGDGIMFDSTVVVVFAVVVVGRKS